MLKESEIDRICSRHYSDFLNSINEMLKMKVSATHLSQLVGEVHQEFHSTGGDLVGVLQALSKIQTERYELMLLHVNFFNSIKFFACLNAREHTKKSLETIIACRELTILMNEVKKAIESDQHYQAMRTIEVSFSYQLKVCLVFLSTIAVV